MQRIQMDLALNLNDATHFYGLMSRNAILYRL